MVGTGLSTSASGASRFVATLGAAAFIVLLAAPVRAQRSGAFGPSPAGRALALIADDDASGESLAVPVLEAAAKRWPHRLFPRLVDVLEDWVREDRSRLPLVLDAFGRASAGIRSEAAAVALVDAAGELKRRLDASPVPKPVRTGWVRPRPGAGVPLPWAVEGLSARDLSERRIAFVDVRLPKESRTAYVRSAFEAFLAPSCGVFLGGEVAEACVEVGLRPLRWAALQAGFSGLSGDGREPGLVDAYLGVDAGLTGRVLDGVSYGFPSAPCEECVILRSWLRKRPTSWQVRAALEPPLEP
jgi:hypothetical protein